VAQRLAGVVPAALLSGVMVALLASGAGWRRAWLPVASPAAPVAVERVVFATPVPPQATVGSAGPAPDPRRVAGRPGPAGPAITPVARDSGGAATPAQAAQPAAAGADDARRPPAASGGAPPAEPAGALRLPRPKLDGRQLDSALRAVGRDLAAQRGRPGTMREDAGRLLEGRAPGELTAAERSAAVIAAMADERRRGGARPHASSVASGPGTSGGSELAGASIRVGLPGGGPTRQERERDRKLHAQNKVILARIDDHIRRRADSAVARAESLRVARDTSTRRPPAGVRAAEESSLRPLAVSNEDLRRPRGRPRPTRPDAAAVRCMRRVAGAGQRVNSSDGGSGGARRRQHDAHHGDRGVHPGLPRLSRHLPGPRATLRA
jgi:hypothetical protein